MSTWKAMPGENVVGADQLAAIILSKSDDPEELPRSPVMPASLTLTGLLRRCPGMRGSANTFGRSARGAWRRPETIFAGDATPNFSAALGDNPSATARRHLSSTRAVHRRRAAGAGVSSGVSGRFC
ncbi:MAG: hypothetical protein HPM95_16730 [Alphaproteobacteria bacterium]|nr:hypothetical protein [Alphaproteobacteria bacterium]